MYHKGEGVPKDAIKAYLWLEVAATLKSVAASEVRSKVVELRSFLAEQLTLQQRAKAKAWAKNCAGSDYKNCF